MSVKTLFTLNAVIMFLFGLGFLFAPGVLLDLYGARLSATGITLARFLGGTQVAIAVLSWLVKDAPASQARRAVLISLFVDWIIGLIIAVVAQLTGVFNALGWVTVILMLLFALGFGYFLIIKSSS